MKTHQRRFSRRTLLKATGTGLVVIAGGGVWRAVDQEVFDPRGGAAYAPWRNWQDAATGPDALVAAAILAANAHNIQPWLFRLADQRIDLLVDDSRSIGAVDPFAREREISLGCALENLLVTGRALGYAPALTLQPALDEPALVASVALSDDSPRPSPLYDAIPHRHTNRYDYDTSRPVQQFTIDALQSLDDSPNIAIRWFVDEADRSRVGQLLVDAAKAINADHEQSGDNILRWLRQDADAIERHRDGLTLDATGLSEFELIEGKMLPKPSLSSAADSWVDGMKRHTATAGAFGILAVCDPNDRGQRVEVGQLWQRFHLTLTAEGLVAQPMNQLHERADRERQLELEPVFGRAVDELIGDPSWHGIFAFRLGYPTEQAPPSPRRSLASVITT